MKLAKIFAVYFFYSIVVGGFLQSELLSAFGVSVYALMAGPSITFGRMHGLEFYILATALFFPIFYAFSKNLNFWINGALLIVFIALWIAFGNFLK